MTYIHSHRRLLEPAQHFLFFDEYFFNILFKTWLHATSHYLVTNHVKMLFTH